MSLVCKCLQCFIHVHTIAITIIACFSLLLDRSLKMDHSEALLYPQPLASSNMALDRFRFKLIWIQMCTESRFREILKCHRFQACFSDHQSLTDTASFNRQHLTLRSHPAVHDAKGQKEMALRLPGSRTHHLHLQKCRRILNHQADGRMSPRRKGWSLLCAGHAVHQQGHGVIVTGKEWSKCQLQHNVAGIKGLSKNRGHPPLVFSIGNMMINPWDGCCPICQFSDKPYEHVILYTNTYN